MIYEHDHLRYFTTFLEEVLFLDDTATKSWGALGLSDGDRKPNIHDTTNFKYIARRDKFVPEVGAWTVNKPPPVVTLFSYLPTDFSSMSRVSISNLYI